MKNEVKTMENKDKILINPETGKEYENVPVRVAAEFLSTSPQAVRDGIKLRTAYTYIYPL